MNSADLPGLRALLVVAMAGAWVSTAGPVSARSCDDLTGLVTVASGRTEVVLALPRQFEGRPLRPSAVTVTQGSRDVSALAVERSSPALIDVVVVLDTSVRVRRVEEESKRAAKSLLSALPQQVGSAVIATSPAPVMVQALTPRPRDAAAKIDELKPGGAGALNDAVILAVQQLPADPVRQQHVVVLAAGPDTQSTQDWASVRSLLDRRGVSLDVIDLTSSRSMPEAGTQCPMPTESAGGGAAEVAAAKVAASILDRRRIVLPEVDPGAPLRVTVAFGGVSRSATLTRRGDSAVDSVAVRRTPHSAVGSEALVLALLLGLLAISAFLLLNLWRTERGRTIRRAAVAVLSAALQRFGERGVPDEARRIPRAEGLRRLAYAWHDLDAVIADRPSARTVAEQEAHLEDDQRRVAEKRDAALRQRVFGRDLAVQRREHAVSRAQEVMAVERARRQRVLLAAEEDARRSLGGRIEITKSARPIAAAEEAPAELAAATGLVGSGDRGAADPRSSVGEPAPAQQIDLRRAESGVAVGQGASFGAAAVPLRSSPRPRLEVVRRLGSGRRDTHTVEPEAEEPVEPEVEEPVEPEVEDADEPEVEDADEPAGEGPVEQEVDEPVEPVVEVDDSIETVESDVEDADEPASAQTAGEVLVVPNVEDVAELAAETEQPVEGPGELEVEEPEQESAQPTHAAVPAAGRAVRAAAAAVLPFALMIKTGMDSRWWANLAGVEGVVLAVAISLSVVGSVWLWRATRPPRALRRRHSELVVQAANEEAVRIEQARVLLDRLDDPEAAVDAWESFESMTSLSVPRSTRSLIDPQMDPGALVRYLAVRQRVTPAREQSLLMVAAVPSVLCLLPALAMVLSL